MAATTEQKKFHLIFIDKELPDGGAVRAATLIKAVKGVNQATPIIAMAFEKNFTLTKSFDDVLGKPFSKEEVEEKVRQWGLIE